MWPGRMTERGDEIDLVPALLADKLRTTNVCNKALFFLNDCMKFCCTKNEVSTLPESAVLIGNLFVYRPDKAERHLQCKDMENTVPIPLFSS
jgi:hypothetical protein